jgi:hypothetical protein
MSPLLRAEAEAPMPWEAQVVVGVVRGALAASDTRTLILAETKTAESRLLLSWLENLAPEIDVLSPPLGLLERILREVEGEGTGPFPGPDPAGPAGESHGSETSWYLASLLRRATGGLTADASNRTAVILGGRLPPVDLLPLGDVPASRILALQGACTLPPPFPSGPVEPRLIQQLERAVDAWHGGASGERAAEESGLAGGLQPALAELLNAGPRLRSLNAQVPKLGGATPGIDLDQ